MLDDFIMNDSYDAWSEEFDEMMGAWDEYCKELAEESDDLKN